MTEAGKYIPGLGTAFRFGTEDLDIESIKKEVSSGSIDAYTKEESDSKYQPVGEYAISGMSYTKAESDGKYQAKGNYATTGTSYTKSESDGKYALKTDLSGKLTATKMTSQSNSTAEDIAGLVTDFNSLLAKLKAAGLMS